MTDADFCKCHDDGCSERQCCRRWTERRAGKLHLQSLFPFDTPLDQPCPLRLPVDAKPAAATQPALLPAPPAAADAPRLWIDKQQEQRP